MLHAEKHMFSFVSRTTLLEFFAKLWDLVAGSLGPLGPVPKSPLIDPLRSPPVPWVGSPIPGDSEWFHGCAVVP